MTFPATKSNAIDGPPGVGTEIVAALINNLENKVGINNDPNVDSLDYMARNAFSWGNHAGLYLPIAGTAADSDKLDGQHGSYYAISGGAPTAHALIDAIGHTVAGLTTGHFLKATGATTYGFGAHGLGYSDVGAVASGTALLLDQTTPQTVVDGAPIFEDGIVSGTIVPSAVWKNLGASDNKWYHLYLAGSAYLANAQITGSASIIGLDITNTQAIDAMGRIFFTNGLGDSAWIGFMSEGMNIWTYNPDILYIDGNGHVHFNGDTVYGIGKLGIIEGGASPTKYTYLQGGDQVADITYTLPTASPTTNSKALLGSTAGVLSWGTNFGANDILTTGTLGAGAITGTSFNGNTFTTGTGTITLAAGKVFTLNESLTVSALPIGSLAVATAANTLGSLAVGLTTQVLVGGGAGTVPAWSTDLPTALTIGGQYNYRAGGTDIPVTDGGTGVSTLALNGVLFGNGTNAVGITAIGAEGQILRVGASPFVPAWTTAIYPNTTTAYRLLVSTGTSVIGELAAVGATGQYLAGVTGAIPSWATLNQAAVAGLTTADSPTWVTGKFTTLTNGYLPYHASDAAGLADSNIYTNGAYVNIGGADLAQRLGVTGNIKLIKGNDSSIFGQGYFGGSKHLDISYLTDGGVRILQSASLDGSGLQFFGGTDASYPGQAYIDYGSYTRTIAGRKFVIRNMSLSTISTVIAIDASGTVGIVTTLAGAGVTYQKLSVNGSQLFVGADSTQESPMFQVVPSYVVNTHASYTSRTILSQWAIGGAQEMMRFESGAAGMLGFLGAGAVVRQTGYAVPTDLTTCISALTVLRTAIINYGLITTV